MEYQELSKWETEPECGLTMLDEVSNLGQAHLPMVSFSHHKGTWL